MPFELRLVVVVLAAFATAVALGFALLPLAAGRAASLQSGARADALFRARILPLVRGAMAALATALGGLKGLIMKVAQLLATIPEALPAEYASELGQLQSHAPPMGTRLCMRIVYLASDLALIVLWLLRSRLTQARGCFRRWPPAATPLPPPRVLFPPCPLLMLPRARTKPTTSRPTPKPYELPSVK